MNVYWIVDDWFWNVLPAADGSVSVSRRWFRPVWSLRSACFPSAALSAATGTTLPAHVYRPAFARHAVGHRGVYGNAVDHAAHARQVPHGALGDVPLVLVVHFAV